MRNAIILAAIAFVIALTVIVGTRLSNEAAAVVVGAMCGISACIPISIALVIATRQGWGHAVAPLGVMDAIIATGTTQPGDAIRIMRNGGMIRWQVNGKTYEMSADGSNCREVVQGPTIYGSAPTTPLALTTGAICDHGIKIGAYCPICSRRGATKLFGAVAQ